MILRRRAARTRTPTRTPTSPAPTLSTATSLVLLLSALLSPTAAQDPNSFDCRPSVGGVQYDLTGLGGVQVARRERPSPPTTFLDELRFDLCGELPLVEGKPQEDQTNWKENVDRVTAVIPLASSSPAVEVSALSLPEGLNLLFHGSSYPDQTPKSTIQSLSVRLTCAASLSEPQFVSYEGGQATVEFDSPLACRNHDEPPPQEDDKKGGDGSGGDTGDAPIEHVGSGLGFFFLMLFLAFGTYFVLGAYYNYSTYGARGLDLIPHRDFWREVPYMLRDVVNHLCSSVRPRRSSRGGYIAV